MPRFEVQVREIEDSSTGALSREASRFTVESPARVGHSSILSAMIHHLLSQASEALALSGVRTDTINPEQDTLDRLNRLVENLQTTIAASTQAPSFQAPSLRVTSRAPHPSVRPINLTPQVASGIEPVIGTGYRRQAGGVPANVDHQVDTLDGFHRRELREALRLERAREMGRPIPQIHHAGSEAIEAIRRAVQNVPEHPKPEEAPIPSRYERKPVI